MGKKDLTALDVNRLVRQGVPGRYRVGKNLYLQVRESGSASWLFRYSLDSRVIGKTRSGRPKRNGAHWMGLGSFNRFSLDEAIGRKPVSLGEARQKARQQGQKLTDYVDPLAAKRKVINDLEAKQAKNITFRECASEYLEIHKSKWKNEKHADQWKATLENYAFPIIGDMNVADIDEAHLVKVLQPIWRKIPETARRLRGRIESILGYATASKRRSGLNPARWRDNLQTLLGGMVITVKHHPALPYKEIPAFMSELRSKDSVSARALEFAILTATRTAEVIGARWSEIAFKEKLWIIPKERMKGGREHRVPLSERALQILSGLQGNDDLFVFGTLSNMAMLEMLRGMRSGVVVHGFRSSFDDWVSEKTNYPSIVTDKALAHKVKDKVEAAYRRGDLFEKRQLLMDDWAAYCMSPPVVDDANVTQFRRGRAS